MTKLYSDRAMRAAERICARFFTVKPTPPEKLDWCAAIISEETGDLDLLKVVEAMANFSGRNNNSHLKEMARAALAKTRGEG